MSLVDVRAALVSQIKAYLSPAYRVYAGVSPQPTAPCVVVDLGEIVYHDSMDVGSAVVTFDVTVLVPRTVGSRALEELDDALSPTGATSIRAAVESDRTLGGKVATTTCRRAERVQPFSLGGVELVGSRVEVEVRM